MPLLRTAPRHSDGPPAGSPAYGRGRSAGARGSWRPRSRDSPRVNARLERRARVLQGLPADGQRASRRTLDQPAIVSMTAAVPVPEVARPLAPEPIETTAAPEPAEGPVPPPSPDRTGPLPPPARRGSVLAGFMEERNILWGEVVGGLLIVGCSIALIVTLWHRLESIPYFPFLLSAAVTLALYGQVITPCTTGSSSRRAADSWLSRSCSRL